MQKPKLDVKNALIISVFLLLVVSLSLVFYYNHKINKMNEDVNAKILVLNKNLGQLEQDLEEQLDSLRNNLSSEVGVLDTNLKNFKKQNGEEMNTLTTLIDEIEQQSNIKLGELKDELKGIQVQSQDFTAIIDDVLPSVVSVGTDTGQGSGVVVDSRGFIATNYHVVEDAEIIRVLTYEGDVYKADLIGYNSLVDVAVLKVDASLPELSFGDSDEVKVGEKVIALGNPAGLDFSVTEGIVSAVHRAGSNNLKIYLQTDVPINPGNSGGPLVDINSKIVGINNFKISGLESLGFALESNTVKQVAEEEINDYYQQISG
jgi:S1-C subfamily serine protease